MIRTTLLRLAWLAAPLRLLAHGDLHDQIDAVSKEILAAPEKGALFLRRAELRRAHQEWAPALEDYARAQALKADADILHLGRGKLFLATGEATKACAELDPLIEKSPAHVDALATRARARAKAADKPGAVADYSAAIESSTRPEPEYFLERAALLVASDPPQFAGALRGIDAGIARLGPAITLVLAALDIEVKSRQFDAAVARINRAVAGAKRPEQWLVRRGEVLDLAARHSEARAAWAEALKAIEALPPRHRQVPATVELERRIRQRLSTTGDARPPPARGN